MVANELEPATSILLYGGFGYIDMLETTLKQANTDINNCFRILNESLKDKTYIVTSSLTIADLYLSTVILGIYRFYHDEKARK
jgi:glutathione S-transferase